MKTRTRWGKRATFAVGITLAFAYFFPFFLVFVNSVKLKYDILENPLSFPAPITWDTTGGQIQADTATNSLIITFFSVSLLIVFSSMLAYYLARTKTKSSKYIFLGLVASMIVPFQALMIPFMALFAPFVSWNNRASLVFFYIGFGVALSTFLYHGFISTIPTEIDEAASIDGASDMEAFWKIIFPMMRPITATVAIINALWIWNDFLLPRLVLTRETQTLPLSTYLFFGQYSIEYGQAMAGLALAVIPIVIFYLILQRQFISGISQGAIK